MKKAVVFFEYSGNNPDICNITYVKEYATESELYEWVKSSLEKWDKYNYKKWEEYDGKTDYHVTYVDDNLPWIDDSLEDTVEKRIKYLEYELTYWRTYGKH